MLVCDLQEDFTLQLNAFTVTVSNALFPVQIEQLLLTLDTWVWHSPQGTRLMRLIYIRKILDITFERYFCILISHYFFH